jgi:hypothetical protein
MLTGCTATFTNLTPKQQLRSANNLYQVEVAFNSRQQSLRWNSIKPQIIVGTEVYPMKQTVLMSNRWEGLVPVPASGASVQYHYKFDYEFNAFGKPQPDSASSPEYLLRIVGE